jgi:hypothetical protein
MRTRSLASPFASCTLVWAIVLLGFYLGPFSFDPEPSPRSLAALFAFIALFVFSSLFGYGSAMAEAIAARPSAPVYRRFDVDAIMDVLSLLAVFGTACIVVDRIRTEGLSGLAGFTELRYERAADLLAAAELSRGLLTYLGYLFYPALYLAVALGITYYEALGIRAKLLLALNMVCPFVLAVFFGGRSPILVVFLIVASSLVARRQLGLRGIPSGAGLKSLAIVGILAFFVYTNIIWFQRLGLSPSAIDILLGHAATVWGIAPGTALESRLAELGMTDALLPLLGLWFYMFQGPMIFERLIDSNSLPILFGGYHIDVVAAVFRMFGPTRAMLSDGYGRLLDADVYGYFPTAWGSLLIDFSLLSVPFVALWGWLSGRVFARLRRYGGPGDAVLYVFLFYSILISPISAPLGLANSFLIFLYFAGFKLWAARDSAPMSA